MTSEELNNAIGELDGDVYHVEGLDDTGKCFPYIGWFWRTVDFDDFLKNGYAFGDCVGFVGFMGNNKWGYASHWATPEQCAEIYRLIVAAVTEPWNGSLQAVFDSIQAIASPAERATAARIAKESADEADRIMAELRAKR